MLYKKILPTFLISLILLISGCISIYPFNSFSIKSYEIVDDDGFPAIRISFSTSSQVILELYDDNDVLLSSDIIFYTGDRISKLDIGEYNEIPLGRYTLKVYDIAHIYELYEKSFSFKFKDLLLFSDQQKWWEDKKGWILGIIVLQAFNKAKTPIYPYMAKLTVNNSIYYGRILPTVILPFKHNKISCIFYQYIPINSYANITLLDINDNIIGEDNIFLAADDILPTETFNWRYKHILRSITLPSADILYTYYTKLDRIYYEDYSVYVFDRYDNTYIDLLSEKLLEYSPMDTIDRINFIASFVQHLEYREDPDNGSVEYPFYPLETLYTNGGGGDCEDKAILTASILKDLGYNVSLLRFPNHMAIGVNIAKNIPNREKYIDNYYFLETTTENHKLGEIPSSYRDRKNVTIYPLVDKPIPIHTWKNQSITIYRGSPYGDFIKAEVIVENLGLKPAIDVEVIAGFFQDSIPFRKSVESIHLLKPGMKKEVVFILEIPENAETVFKTQVKMSNKIFDEREAVNSFP